MNGLQRVVRLVFGVSLLAAALVGNAAASSGRTAAPAPRSRSLYMGKSAPAARSLAPDVPSRYQVVSTGPVPVAPENQNGAVATCPAGSVVYGGGVTIASGSLVADVNSSWPYDSTHWAAYVDNGALSSTTFTVYAVCAKQNAKWSIQYGTDVANPSGEQTVASVSCPAGTKVLGGGGYSSSSNTLYQDLNSSYPVKLGTGSSATYSWFIYVNNASGQVETENAVAVCGSAKGYRISQSKYVADPPGSNTPVGVTCTAPKVPLGGGVRSTSSSTAVDINSTSPFTSGWNAYENNGSTGDDAIRAYAVCAGI